MAKIRKDETGIFIYMMGDICRPLTEEDHGYTHTPYGIGTQFEEGEYVRTSNYAGETIMIKQGKRGASDYKVEMWLRREGHGKFHS